jgi:ribonuclease T2
MRRTAGILLPLAVLLLPACHRSDSGKQSSAPPPSATIAKREPVRRTANFDYYLLALSWSPEYCSNSKSGRDGQQCGEGRRFGFVVHGLWPQAAGGNPQKCGTSPPVPESVIDEMLPIMPSSGLIQHEWTTHGTCSGLDVAAYFKEVRSAYDTVKVPGDYKQPQKQIMVRPAEVTEKFARANGTFPPDAFRLRCSGRYLTEVRVCMNLDLTGRACDASVPDNCRADEVILRPVR